MNQNNTDMTLEQTLRSLLPELQDPEVACLIDAIADIPAELTGPPETGVVMAQTRDCFDVDFYLGEVLVTSAEVECFGRRGYATIMGDDSKKAVLAATVSALTQSGKTDLVVAKLASLLEKYSRKFAALRNQENLLKAATKVNFESMAEET